jgi:hypothetical protein
LRQAIRTTRLAVGGSTRPAEIGAEVGTFMLAGHETTANTLAWSLALLSTLSCGLKSQECLSDCSAGLQAGFLGFG